MAEVAPAETADAPASEARRRSAHLPRLESRDSTRRVAEAASIARPWWNDILRGKQSKKFLQEQADVEVPDEFLPSEVRGGGYRQGGCFSQCLGRRKAKAKVDEGLVDRSQSEKVAFYHRVRPCACVAPCSRPTTPHATPRAPRPTHLLHTPHATTPPRPTQIGATAPCIAPRLIFSPTPTPTPRLWQVSQLMKNPKTIRAFALFDGDASGTIDKSELTKVMLMLDPTPTMADADFMLQEVRPLRPLRPLAFHPHRRRTAAAPPPHHRRTAAAPPPHHQALRTHNRTTAPHAPPLHHQALRTHNRTTAPPHHHLTTPPPHGLAVSLRGCSLM